jgi:hypothetical protein
MKCKGGWYKGKTREQADTQFKNQHFCSIEGCGKKHFGQGYKKNHHYHLCRKGLYPCSVEGCEGRATTKRLCAHHHWLLIGKKRGVVKNCSFCSREFLARQDKTHEYRFCSTKCAWKDAVKERTISKEGYVSVPLPLEEQKGTQIKRIYEHRLIMEKHIGRKLTKKEIVHHIDENTGNNIIENLMLFPDVTSHMAHHRKMRKKKQLNLSQSFQSD